MALLTVRTFQAAGGAIARIAVNSTDTISAATSATAA
jgi:hypothetical protein